MPVLRKWLGVFISFGLVMAVFPDVVFNGTSIRITDQFNGYLSGLSFTNPFPKADHTEWWSGMNDSGGALFQFEPGIQFVKNAIENRDSVYWNPYSAAGSLGPEVAVDLKLSAFTLANALLGGGSLAYNILFLISYFIGALSVYSIANRFFRLSPLGATAASLFFLLNGYSVANLGSNVTLSYPFVAFVLYAALLLVNKQSIRVLALFACALAIMMSFSFMPTLVTSLLMIGFLVLAQIYLEATTSNAPKIFTLKVTGCLGLGAFIAFLIVSPIYLPFIESIKTVELLSEYSERKFFPIYFPNALNLFFSPSLFFESYNAMELRALAFAPGDYSILTGAFTRTYAGNTIYHFGTVAIFLVISTFSVKAFFSKIIYKYLFFIFILIILRISILAPIFYHIPVIGTLGTQYWWAAIIIPFAFLVGYGLDLFYREGPKPLWTIAAGLLLCGTIWYTWKTFGLQEPNMHFKSTMLLFTVCIAFIFVLIVAIYYIPSGKTRKAGLAICILILLFAELAVHSKMVRYQRNDAFIDLEPALQFVQENIGLQRSLNFFNTGLYSELGSAFGIQEFSAMSPSTMPAFRRFFFSAVNLEISQRQPLFPSLRIIRDEPEKNSFDFKKLSLAGIKYILIPGSFMNYKAWLLDRGWSIAFQTPRTMVLENPDLVARSFVYPVDRGQTMADFKLPQDFQSRITPAQIESYRNASVVIKGDAKSDGLVVLTDNWHPNWTASLNGAEADIIKVQGTFRGIKVAKGPFRIEMTYRPKSLSIAQTMCLLGVALVVLLGFFGKKIEQRLITMRQQTVSS